MKALVLSGGGSKGAFQAGALDVLSKSDPSGYGMFCGVSVGAINAAHLSQFVDISEGAKSLLDLWSGLSTKKVHKRWFPFGYVSALWKRSARDTTPLHQLIAKRFDRQEVLAAKKRLIVGAVSLKNYQYRSFTELEAHIDQAVLASSAFPAMLEPVEIEGELYVDGGVRNVTPLGDAIRAGASEVTVILTEPKTSGSVSQPANALGVGLKAFEIMMSEIVETDLKLAMAYNHIQNKQLIPIKVIRPRGPIGPSNPLDFDNDQIHAMIEAGRESAKEFLSRG